MKHRTHTKTNSVRECLMYCNKCKEICAQAIMYCLEHAGGFADMSLISVLLENIKFCKMNADFIVRQGYPNQRILMLCREKCLVTAKVCGSRGELLLETAAKSAEECALKCVGVEECVKF